MPIPDPYDECEVCNEMEEDLEGKLLRCSSCKNRFYCVSTLHVLDLILSAKYRITSLLGARRRTGISTSSIVLYCLLVTCQAQQSSQQRTWMQRSSESRGQLRRSLMRGRYHLF